MEPFIEFRSKFTHAATLLGSVYFGNVKLMDFIANLNYPLQEGKYLISVYQSPKFKREVLLLTVPGHEYIEVHPADWSHELSGCMAVGSFDGWQKNPKMSYAKLFAHSNSSKHLDELIAYVKRTQIRFLQVTHSECIKVYLTGRS